MKLRNIIATFFTITLLLSSCEDFLDVQPVGKLIPTKVTEVENLLNNTNTIDFQFLDNNRGCFYAYLGDNLSISETQVLYTYVSTHPNIDRYAAYTFYQPYTNPNTTHYFWNWGIYRSVGLFNNTIGAIAGLSASERDSEYAKGVVAQAKAARAWIYLAGGLVYGPAYNPDGNNDVKVIPYRVDESPLAPNPDLSTTAEIFELVLQDLTDALDAPDNVGNPTRANKSAVYALHAQYYMFKRDWPNMLSFADRAWQVAIATKGSVDNFIYDFNDFEYNQTTATYPEGTDPEVSWTIRHKGGDVVFAQSSGRENLLYRISPAGSGIYPSDEYINLFDKDNDLRYKLFMLKVLGTSAVVGGVTYDDGIKQRYYRGSKLLFNEGLTYPVLLLMRAEAYARTGDLPKALADLNTLRHYRYDNSNPTDLPNGASLNADQLLNEILNERRRELPIESFQRTLDLKRYVYDAGKPWSKTSITHYIGSQAYTAPIDNAHYTLPIDNAIINFNPQWGLTPNLTPYLPRQ
jgi:hypothetical protein